MKTNPFPVYQDGYCSQSNCLALKQSAAFMIQFSRDANRRTVPLTETSTSTPFSS